MSDTFVEFQQLIMIGKQRDRLYKFQTEEIIIYKQKLF